MSPAREYVTAAHAVEQFESAVAAGRAPDLAEFAPPTDDPSRPGVLAELIRVDLEYGWRDGRPVSLDDYRRRFPDAFTAVTRKLGLISSKVRRDPECPICSREPDEITDDELGVFPDYEAFCAAAG